MLGVFIAFHNASESNDSAARASLSLGFQLFTVITFVPGMLGGLVIPYLANKKMQDANKSSSPIVVIYAAIAAISGIGFLLATEIVLSAYNIPRTETTILVLRIVVCTAIPAAANAYFIQSLGANRRFGFLAANSAICFSLIVIVSLAFPGSALAGAWSILATAILSGSLCYLAVLFEGKRRPIQRPTDAVC